METIHEFPFFPIEFTKEGQAAQPAQVDNLLAFLKQQPATDLLVMSHGWNNDMQEARGLYDRLLGVLRQDLENHPRPALAARKFAALGVLWPSKKFADKDLIAGGAASAEGLVSNEVLLAELDELRDVFDAPNANELLDVAKDLVPLLDNKQSVRTAFTKLLRALVPGPETAPDVAATQDFKTQPAAEIIANLGQPLALDDEDEPASAGPPDAGQVAGVGDFIGNIKDGALNLLNFTTYYQMKERAGKVGQDGLHPVLVQARQAAPETKFHLIGHSFGGRLVTAAAGAAGQPAFKVSTLALLQAAFSHYGFAANYDGSKSGFFRSLITDKTVTGPIIISHSIKDTAVGRMYPLASRLAHQVASALGDENDQYGGMGRNGAQKTPGATAGQLLATGAAYTFEPGHLYNLNADTIIQDHSDISRAEVASAILQAIAST